MSGKGNRQRGAGIVGRKMEGGWEAGQKTRLVINNRQTGNLRFPRAVDDPRELPELRQRLIELAVEGGAWEGTEIERSMLDACGPGATRRVEGQNVVLQGPRGYGPDEISLMSELALSRGKKSCDWYRRGLPETQLIHVHPELVDLVEQTAPLMPDDLTIEAPDAPAPWGLVVLGRPIYGLDSSAQTPGRRIRIDGFMWGMTNLPPKETDWMLATEFTEPAWSVASFRFLEPGQPKPDMEEHGLTDEIETFGAQLDRRLWLPLGRSDWPHGSRLDEPHRPDIPTDSPTWESMMEDRRLIAALWGILNQRRLVVRTQVSFNRQQLRQLERRNVRRESARVEVVHLRRSEYVTTGETALHGRLTVRFPVRPHPRRQPYGPGRTLTKLIIVPGHWKGPLDAPIVHTERVWELDR